MITLKDLKWSNILSYQDNNYIDLNKEPLTQLIGENGAGKTSIPLIIQEILYGKNVKNIKKQDLINRHSNKNGYHINLVLFKNDDKYEIDLDRKSTIKLHLYKNGENISSHKSLDTYKQIAEIIGISDFKTFAQLVYQSSTGSLEFLTATDTNRKRFLISLLQLDKYLDLHELFKAKLKSKNNELSNIQGKIEITEGWIHRHEKIDLTKKEVLPIPDSSKQEIILKKIASIQNDLNGIKKTNQKIVDNNQYIKDLKELNFDPTAPEPKYIDPQETKAIDKHITIAEISGKEAQKQLKNLKTEESVCPTCGQIIPAVDSTALKVEIIKFIEQNNQEIQQLKIERTVKVNENQIYIQWENDKRQFEKLLMLIDQDLPKETLDKAELEAEVIKLNANYNKLKKDYDAIIAANEEAAKHNSKINVIKEQLKEYHVALTDLKLKFNETKEETNLLDVLKRVFSTNGLISYKIESSVKELEKTINEYLAEFSHFQIFFKLDKEKLNIQVIDETGEETTVEGLSAGELGRVNIATVLAIRKIMSTLTSTEINFLFLDEIVGVLDSSGKEKLTEILLRENLNTFMVAHEFDHPLVPKLNIIKENNISRIEEWQ